MGKKKKKTWVKHYCVDHKILLVGEGDFSFAACLARSFRYGRNILATSLLSKEELAERHCMSTAHVKLVRRLLGVVLHGVDVHSMHQDYRLGKKSKFDRIVFNFPHAGHEIGLCEGHADLIKKHKHLMKGFFLSSRERINDDGEIHVAHRNDMPYKKWDIVKLADEAGLALIGMEEFRKEDYPGYHNKRGGDIKGDRTFPVKEAFTFKFSKKKPEIAW